LKNSILRGILVFDRFSMYVFNVINDTYFNV